MNTEVIECDNCKNAILLEKDSLYILNKPTDQLNICINCFNDVKWKEDGWECDDYEDETPDYCEQCYKTIGDKFVEDGNRCDGAKWCTQDCLDKYHIKNPPLATCGECFKVVFRNDLKNDNCTACDFIIRHY